MTYSAKKFEVAMSNCLGGGTFTRIMTDAHPHGHTDARTDRRTTDRLWYEINIPFFLKKKAGITNHDIVISIKTIEVHYGTWVISALYQFCSGLLLPYVCV